jgi:hypothetical protein
MNLNPLPNDDLRAQLLALLQPMRPDEESILARVRYLLLCEKVVACWRKFGLPF